MTNRAEVQYVSDADGKEVGVIVPMDLWHEINSECETVYLLKSENMKRRLLGAKERQVGISLEDALNGLGWEFTDDRRTNKRRHAGDG